MSRCFLSRMDVVGYSNIYRADPKSVNKMLGTIVKKLKKELSRYNRAAGVNNGLRFHQMYGDTLDISFETGINDEIHFLALMDVTCMIQKELMKSGLMVRGAVLCDDLIDNKLIFTGMAMVEAAALEKELDSPHLVLREEAVEMLKMSAPLLFPNKKDQEKYLEQTLYDNNKLDCFCHVPYVIHYPVEDDIETLQKCTDCIRNVSLSNIRDERSLETAQRLLIGLKDYCQYRSVYCGRVNHK